MSEELDTKTLLDTRRTLVGLLKLLNGILFRREALIRCPNCKGIHGKSAQCEDFVDK